ncbi:MAG: glutamate synthase domain-containing protein 2, partial [Phycisphaerales bacterium]
MFRRWFFIGLALTLALVAVGTYFWPPLAFSLIVIVPIAAVGLRDSFQHSHTILRNFPVIGHARYLMEELRPEFHQYFIESNTDAYPIDREMRELAYQRAKGALETKPFGSQRDFYQVGYEWGAHSLRQVVPLHEEPRLLIGDKHSPMAYAASRLNISAMSYGALSPNAVLALNMGAKLGGFAHNTGEGGISPYHLENGGDLIWQIGTGYFGCRTKDGEFDQGMFAENASQSSVRLIEVKLSQGAKPGHGGVLPGVKVNAEIARIRGVPIGQTVISPAWHMAFATPVGLLEFLQRLREAS